jgi:hypothetical protein
MLYALTPVGAICFYAGLNMLAFGMIFLWLPETKQRTLEELDYIFGVPTRKFIAYNFRIALPWWWKRWVLFDKTAKLAPLYHFDGVEGAQTAQQSDSDTEIRRSASNEKSGTVTRDM